jgi:broad specificity phosphatase PhoE
MSIKSVALACIVLAFSVIGGGCARDTTVILVRHAEKGAGQDPALTPEGQARAEALVTAVGRAGVSAIYVTNFQRTQQTAAPLAAELGLTPIVMGITGSAQAHAAAVAADIRANRGGQRVLVVGHSNTVTMIMAELGITGVQPINDATEFDRLFVVTLRKDAAARVVEARYGE